MTTTMTMSLADAIRKGAGQHPQCMGTFFQRHPLDGITASCVNGAALVGLLGADTSTAEILMLFQAYPALLTERFAVCPVTPACARFLLRLDGGAKPLYLTLAHLNDVHQWTREQCADWLEAR